MLKFKFDRAFPGRRTERKFWWESGIRRKRKNTLFLITTKCLHCYPQNIASGESKLGNFWWYLGASLVRWTDRKWHICRILRFERLYGMGGAWLLSYWQCVFRVCESLVTHTDIRLRRGVATPLARYGPLRPNVTSSIKPEVHNISQRCQRRTEPQPQGSAQKISWRSFQRF